jgi:glycosyltransferase involved in cell wall biosynthesis
MDRARGNSVSRHPKLSIGLPVYNGERYLREALDAILGQSFTDFELFVSDNASTDATAEIARDAAARDSRVNYHRNERNVGAAANFTIVSRRATAPYFKWACADDRLAAGFLEAALTELDAHPEAVACYGVVTLIDGEGRELGAYDQDLDLRSPDVVERFLRASAHMGLLHVLHGVIRTAVLDQVAPHRAYRGSDEVIVAELSLHGRIYEIRAPMMFRRMHSEAASAAQSVEQKVAHLDPRKKFSTYYWRHSIEHLRAIARSPLDARTKVRITVRIVRKMIQIRDHLTRELLDAVGYLRSRI